MCSISVTNWIDMIVTFIYVTAIQFSNGEHSALLLIDTHGLGSLLIWMNRLSLNPAPQPPPRWPTSTLALTNWPMVTHFKSCLDQLHQDSKHTAKYYQVVADQLGFVHTHVSIFSVYFLLLCKKKVISVERKYVCRACPKTHLSSTNLTWWYNLKGTLPFPLSLFGFHCDRMLSDNVLMLMA